VVPDECSFTIDRRLNPEEDLDEEKARLLALLEKHRQTGIELQYDVFQEANAARPQFEMCPGLLEIRFYSQCGIPAFAYGPGLLSVSHGPDEYVSVNKLLECADIYALSALDLLSPAGRDLLAQPPVILGTR
jgi:succinyl-diaminopimelate desuccinylase